MRSFLWRGTDSARGGAVVAWSSVCRPFSDGGLGIHHLLHPNSALLCKWVVRVLQPSNDMISCLLREAYGASLDWGEWVIPRRGDSPVMAGLRGILPMVQSFFRPQLGDGADFRFWEDDWLTAFPVSTALPRSRTSQSSLHGLVTGPRHYHLHSRTSVWLISWTPPLPFALSELAVH